MLINEYVVEKLRDLEEEPLTQLALKRRGRHGVIERRSKPIVGPVLRLAGRTLRRAGEGLEGWASPHQPESEPWWAERRT